MDLSIVDDVIQVSDRDAFQMTRRLAQEEGMLAGGSSGTAVCAALKVAENMESDKTIVTLLPDTGRNYLSKLYSDQWMREQGFL
jgi:cystathionine beta-synthase